jgi:hypothetical protein
MTNWTTFNKHFLFILLPENLLDDFAWNLKLSLLNQTVRNSTILTENLLFSFT